MNTECEQEALSVGHKRALGPVVHVLNERDDEREEREKEMRGGAGSQWSGVSLVARGGVGVID